MSSKDNVSGRKVVFILFAGALSLFGIVLTIGYRQKLENKSALLQSSGVTVALRDSATATDSLRAWMSSLPQDWVKVTFVEGQGYVIFVPCYSSNGTLALKSAADTVPALDCEYCDSLGDYAVKKIIRNHADGNWDFGLEGAAGMVRILPVGDSLLRNFPEAPFKDRLLLWMRPRETLGAQTGNAGGVDTMIFVPKSQENEFEVLRAEDENPEGCGGTDSD